MSFVDKMKKVGKSMVETGTRTMLKTDVVFLEREIKARKQRFGVEVYDSMQLLEVDNDMSLEDKERKIRLAFDQARKDIAVIQAKIECKKEEVALLDEHTRSQSNDQFIPPSNGNIIYNGHSEEYGHIN